MNVNTLPKCLRKHADKINDISDERNDDDGYWVYLKNGWFNEFSETHMIHEDTPSECAKQFSFVEACNRECCNHVPEEEIGR